MKNQITDNYRVIVKGMQSHITDKESSLGFSSYESAVTYFQEQCDTILGFFPELTHNPSNPSECSEGGVGYDYRISLEFINE